MRRSGQLRARLSVSAFALLLALSPVQALADQVALRAGTRGDGVRLVFEWPQAVGHSAQLQNARTVKLVFARPAEADVSALPQSLSSWISSASRSADGLEITLTLKRSVRLSSFAAGNRVVVDLAPGASSSPTPAATAPAAQFPSAQSAAAPKPAAPVAATPTPARTAELRIGRHQGFDRAVIKLAARPVVSQQDGKLLLTAPPARRLSDAQLQQLKDLPQVQDVSQNVVDDRLRLAITLAPGAKANTFNSSGAIGIDFKDAPRVAPPAQRIADTAPPPVAAPAKPPVEVTPEPPVAAAAPTVMPPAAPPPVVKAAATPEVDTSSAAPAVTDSTPAEEITPSTPAAQMAEASLPPLEMTVGKGTPLAVFQRGHYLFVVVSDKNTPRELIPLVGTGLASSSRVQLLQAQGGRVIRIDLNGLNVQPNIASTDNGWNIVFGQVAGPLTALAVKEQPDYSLGPRLFVATSNPANPVLFADPVVGDTLAVVPLPTLANGLPARIRTLQSEILPSYQGLVVRSWIEDLNVISTPDGVEISSISGFKLAERLAGEPDQAPLAAAATSTSPQQDGTHAATAAATPNLPPLINFRDFGAPAGDKFTEQREELQNAIYKANGDDKQKAWLNLAKFYFINGMPTEAAAIWQDITKDNADLASRPDFALIRAIAGFSSGTLDNVKAALTAVNQPTTDSSLWRGMLAVKGNDWLAASDAFRPALQRIWEYPEPYRSRLAIAAIDTALQTQDYTMASALLDKLNDQYRTEQHPVTPAVEYLTGALDWGQGKADEARAHLGSAAQSWDQLWRVKAELMLIDADIKDNRTKPSELLSRLERLRYAWRGDGLEFEILHRLAQQHIAANDFAAAFNDYSQMTTKYPDLAQKANIADEQKAAFVRIFQGDDRDRTPAYSQLAIWDRYPEFRPTQPSVLDNINSYLAERSAGIDLLDRAAGFYNDVLKGTTDPAVRATLGTKIAGLQLLDDKYSDAIKTLDATEPKQAADQPTVLRGDAQDERRQLRARAIFGQGKPDDALALLANDYSDPATRLRADIDWKTRRWSEAAATLDALIGDPPAAGQKLSDEKSGLIVSRATALALAGDRTGLRDLRIKFGEAMSATVDAPTFQLLTRPEVAGGLPDRATLTGQVAEVDLFQKFLEHYRAPAAETPDAASAVAATTPTAAEQGTAPAGN